MSRFKNIAAFIVFILFIQQVILSCSSGAKTKDLPKDGTFCFKNDDNSTKEFLQITFSKGMVEGEFLKTEEVNGSRRFHFTGQVKGDTLMKMRVAYQFEEGHESDEDWVLFYAGESLHIRRTGTTAEPVYSLIDCSEMPDFNAYSPVSDAEDEDEGEYEENNPPNCFYYYYPGGNKHIVIREYISFQTSEGKVSGVGAGSLEGMPDWVLNFKGQLIDDSTTEVTVNYRLEGSEGYSTKELWIINMDEGWLRPKSAVTDCLDIRHNWQFHKINCNNVEEYFKKQMRDNAGPY